MKLQVKVQLRVLDGFKNKADIICALFGIAEQGIEKLVGPFGRKNGVEFILDFALALDQLIHFVIGHGLGKAFVDLVKFIDQINGLLNALLDDFSDGFGFIHQRFLLKVADGVALGKGGLSVEFGVHAGHDFQQGAFTGTVEAQHADLGSVEITQGDVFDHGFFIVKFTHPHHGINHFIGIGAHRSLFPLNEMDGYTRMVIRSAILT